VREREFVTRSDANANVFWSDLGLALALDASGEAFESCKAITAVERMDIMEGILVKVYES